MSPFFRLAQPPSSVTIPISGGVGSVFAVYFAPGSEPVRPRPNQKLAEAAASWSDTHIEPPLRDAVAAYRNGGFLSIDTKLVMQLPPIPIDLLHYMGLGELEERIVRAATQVVLVSGNDLNIAPRAGMWAVLAAALGVRELLQGVIFDPDALRIIDPDQAAKWFSPTGTVGVRHHVIVPFSIGDRGLGWMTTRGLGKFGLPDLELRDVPPNLDPLVVLMNAVAQRLVEQTFQSVAEHKGSVNELNLAAEMTVDRTVVARASAREPGEADAGGEATVALRFDSKQVGSGPPMIRVERPPTFSGDTGVWLNYMADQLLGSVDRPIMTKTGSDAMTRAHERAFGELPMIKGRFLDGLKPGEVLFIKHGFPTIAGSRHFIWCAVNRWQGNVLTVQVANDSDDVEGLRLGMTVMLPEADIFDWMLQLPGDRREGGYTSQVAIDEGHEASAE